MINLIKYLLNNKISDFIANKHSYVFISDIDKHGQKYFNLSVSVFDRIHDLV